jgi:hypothetical protein
MISRLLMEYNKNTQGSVGNVFINYHSFLCTLKTLEYHVSLNGTKASRWADVYLNTDRFHSVLDGVSSTNEIGAFILVEIPTDLSGRYTLMPLCNSQRRIYASGTDAIVSVFNVYSP